MSEIEAYAASLVTAAQERGLVFGDDADFQQALALAEEYGYPPAAELLDEHFEAPDDAPEVDELPAEYLPDRGGELPPGVPDMGERFAYQQAIREAEQEREEKRTLDKVFADVDAVVEMIGRPLTHSEVTELGAEARKQLDRYGEFDLIFTAESLGLKNQADMTLEERNAFATDLGRQLEAERAESPRQAQGMENLTAAERDDWIVSRAEELAELRNVDNPVDTSIFNDQQREAYIQARLEGASTQDIADTIRDAIVNTETVEAPE